MQDVNLCFWGSNREKSNIAIVILGKMDTKINSDSRRTNITS